MTRLSLFDSPLLLGFDHFERTLDRIAKSSNDSYPPYNIEQIGNSTIRITLAVAGFTMDDLSVHIEDNQLVIRGKRQENDTERLFIHRGIATRQFQKSFVLADGIEVIGASMDNGLLNVDLDRHQPEVMIKKINIEQGEKAKNADKNGKTLALEHKNKTDN